MYVVLFYFEDQISSRCFHKSFKEVSFVFKTNSLVWHDEKLTSGFILNPTGFTLIGLLNYLIRINCQNSNRFASHVLLCNDYNDIMMGAIASQITSLTIVYSTVYSKKTSKLRVTGMAFVRGIHRRPVNSQHKWQVTRKMFPFDDVIMWRLLLWWYIIYLCKALVAIQFMDPSWLFRLDSHSFSKCHHQMEHFPRYWPFVRGIHRSPVVSLTKASDAEL